MLKVAHRKLTKLARPFLFSEDLTTSASATCPRQIRTISLQTALVTECHGVRTCQASRSKHWPQHWQLSQTDRDCPLAGGRTTGAIISPLCRLRIALGVA